MEIIRTVHLSALLLFFSSAAFGRVLYVAKSGHDTGTGSEDAPFLTIGRAAAEARPGDSVVIHTGTYREEISLNRGGVAEDARIAFTSAPGEMAVIKGSEAVAAWKPEGGSVWRADVPDIIFGSFNPFATPISGAQYLGAAWRHLGEVYLDGIALAEQPSREAVADGAHRWFAQRQSGLTRIWANFGGDNPTQRLVEINVRAAAFSTGTTSVNYVKLDSLSVAQTANNWASLDARQPGAISSGGGTHWIIQDCTITDAKCVGISLEQPGRDLTRVGPNRPAFGEFQDMAAAGHHIIRDNLIQRCGEAGIFGLLHGTCSEIVGNQIEDINSAGQFSGDDVGGIRLAVAIDTIIRHNLVRRVGGGGYGVVLGPLYQGVRIASNVIMETAGSPLYFMRSHGPVLVDNNVISGPGVSTGEGVKLRSAEASVFAFNLFSNCAITSTALSGTVAGGTISYRPHTLVTKQTIPALALDNKWFANTFFHAGLDQLPPEHGAEADYNRYVAGAAKCPWADLHSQATAGDGGFALTSSSPTASDITLNLNLTALPPVQAPDIDTGFIGRYALTGNVEQPDGKPISLPFAQYQLKLASGMRLFERKAGAGNQASFPSRP